MFVSQLSVFIHFYIAETENEVKIEIDNQRATFQRYVEVYINLYYLNVFGLSFSQLDIYVSECCYVLTVIAIPSSVFPLLRFESGISPRTDDPFGFPIVYENVLLVSISASSQTIHRSSAILGECFVR